MKREITFRSPTIAAARDREHWIKQCRSSGCVIGKHRFHTATQLHWRPFSQQMKTSLVRISKWFIHSFISLRMFLFWSVTWKYGWRGSFVWGCEMVSLRVWLRDLQRASMPLWFEPLWIEGQTWRLWRRRMTWLCLWGFGFGLWLRFCFKGFAFLFGVLGFSKVFCVYTLVREWWAILEFWYRVK